MPRMSYKLEDILGAGVVGGDRLERGTRRRDGWEWLYITSH